MNCETSKFIATEDAMGVYFRALLCILIVLLSQPARSQSSPLQPGDYVLTVEAYNSRSERRIFRFGMRSGTIVTQQILERMENRIIEAGFNIPWRRSGFIVPDVEYFVMCPTSFSWQPCAPYDERIYLSCVTEAQVQSPAGQESNEARQRCLIIATDPSWLDMLRYR